MKSSQAVPLLILSLCMAMQAVPSEAHWQLGDWIIGGWHWPIEWLRPPRVAVQPPEIRTCWSPLLRTPGCVLSIFRSLDGGANLLGADCCAAVRGLEEQCSRKMFSKFAVDHDYPSLLKSFCAGSPAPAPATGP